jgi:hypothetical protein
VLILKSTPRVESFHDARASRNAIAKFYSSKKVETVNPFFSNSQDTIKRLQEIESYGYGISWALVAAGIRLGLLDAHWVCDFATHRIEDAADTELPTIACLTSSSLTPNEVLGYLGELLNIRDDFHNYNVAVRKWLVFELNNILNRGEAVVKLKDLAEEDDERIVEVFTELSHIEPLLQCERNQEPIWVPEIHGYGFAHILAQIIREFRRWLANEKTWIANQG